MADQDYLIASNCAFLTLQYTALKWNRLTSYNVTIYLTLLDQCCVYKCCLPSNASRMNYRTIRFFSPTCGPTTRWASLRSSRWGSCTPYRVELRKCVLDQWLGIRVYFGPDPDPLSFFPHISPEPFSIFPPWNRIRVRNADPDSKKVLIVAQKISQKKSTQHRLLIENT